MNHDQPKAGNFNGDKLGKNGKTGHYDLYSHIIPHRKLDVRGLPDCTIDPNTLINRDHVWFHKSNNWRLD